MKPAAVSHSVSHAVWPGSLAETWSPIEIHLPWYFRAPDLGGPDLAVYSLLAGEGL
jgi:hypothetical protein